MTNAIISRIQAMPKTHKVVTVWANGDQTQYEAHSAASAENYAIRMRRAIASGDAVSVAVEPIN